MYHVIWYICSLKISKTPTPPMTCYMHSPITRWWDVSCARCAAARHRSSRWIIPLVTDMNINYLNKTLGTKTFLPSAFLKKCWVTFCANKIMRVKLSSFFVHQCLENLLSLKSFTVFSSTFMCELQISRAHFTLFLHCSDTKKWMS